MNLDDFSLNAKLEIPPHLPSSFTCLQDSKVSESCLSVYQLENILLVGLKNGRGIEKTEEDGQMSKSFLKMSSNVNDFKIHDNKIFALGLRWNSFTLNVYEATGKLALKHSWNHARYDGEYVNKFAIIDNQIIVPHRKDRCLVCYSVEGKEICRVPCPLMSSENSSTYICKSSEESAIISDSLSSQVFRVKIPSGDVMWVSDKVKHPQAVEIYKDEYVLISQPGTFVIIFILDVETGKLKKLLKVRNF